jgi:hypothetical protein
MKREQLAGVIVVGSAGLITAGVLGWGLGIGARAEAGTPAPHSTAVPQYTLSIGTPDMLDNNPVGPAYVPSNVSWPANAVIEVSIVNFDDATALTGQARQYARATGIIGAMSVRELDPGNPNAAGPARQVMALDPDTGVSHTFTIATLGVNAPVAPHAVTTFRFHTGLAGTYQWRCMDPCGSGDSGWGGAMSTKNYMEGTVTLA